MRIVEYIGQIKPFEVRFVYGKIGNRLMTRAELVAVTGLSDHVVRKISKSLSWNKITLEEIDAFCLGCNVDILHMGEVLKNLRRIASGRIKLKHLNWRQKDQLRKMYERLDSDH